MKPVRYKGSHVVETKKQMDPPVVAGDWTQEQIALVRRTFAKEATTDEFSLFMAMANRMQLDIFARQIYFTKYGGKVTIMVSIDGVRLIAHRTGLWNGTSRGVLRDEHGNITHGWAKVWKTGSEHPAYEETPFSEYAKNTQTWKAMPETMIKKVAEMAALRMAFPQELGSAYIAEEFGHEEQQIKNVTPDISERFKEELCNQSSRSSNEPDKQKELANVSSENDVDTVDHTSLPSNPVESSPVTDDGFGPTLPQRG